MEQTQWSVERLRRTVAAGDVEQRLRGLAWMTAILDEAETREPVLALAERERRRAIARGEEEIVRSVDVVLAKGRR